VDHYPAAALADRIADRERKQRGDGPHARCTDEVSDRQDTRADSPGRIFAGIGKREPLFGAETDAGDKASSGKQSDVRSEGAEDRKRPEQQEIELVNRPSPPAIAEFALPGGADEHS